MLAWLSIENFALIEKLSIDFAPGLSIITGETGAGKSILLGALGLALGKRADLTSLKDKDKKCVIEARFNIAGYDLQPFFELNDLDYENETIIRREILPSGKSRAFINDTPVNLQELQEFGFSLIDIHSQHETRELSEEDFQFKIIDAIANNNDLITNYANLLKSYKDAKSQLISLNEELASSLKEQDYNAFLLGELESANLKDGEQEELEAELEKLSNVESIRENFDRGLAIAADEQFGIIKNLKEFRHALQKISGFSEEYKSIFERTDSSLIELDDIVNELTRLSGNLFGDPARLELISEKLQLIYSLQKKHQAGNISELLLIQEELAGKVLSVTNLEEDIARSGSAIREFETELDKISGAITSNRKQAIPELSVQLSDVLQLLGMPNVRFKIEINDSGRYLKNGKDMLEFLFSANKGSDFGLLKKVASGGEMSRIMLAVKSVLSRYSKLPTIIFDEIDTGVSGEIADRMGVIMKSMSSSMQVFAITHLPQIAAKGNEHFRVFKTVSDGRTQSGLEQLSHEQRIDEIARMLSGSAVSDSAINHARALLD